MKTLLLTATAVIAGQDFPLRLVLRGSVADRAILRPTWEVQYLPETPDDGEGPR